jgi:hypothetical protein
MRPPIAFLAGLVTLLLAACSSSPTPPPAEAADPAPAVIHGDSARQAQDWAEFLDKYMPHNPDSAGEAAGEDEFALLNSEHLGGIWVGMASADVEELLGTPELRGEIENWGADGQDHQDWQWPKQGLSLNMTSKGDGPWRVFIINGHEGCDLATARGIKVGDSADAVRAAYQDELDASFPGGAAIMLGSPYGGLSFGLAQDKVISISLGAFAE